MKIINNLKQILLKHFKLKLKFKFVVILFFLFIKFDTCYSVTPYSRDDLTLYYGSSYRFDDTYRHTISLQRYIEHSDSIATIIIPRDEFNVEISNLENFNVGYKLLPMFFHKKNFDDFFVYVGFELNIFKINRNYGLKTSTEIGIIYHSDKFSFNVFYAYDLPMLINNSFSLNKNRIALKLGYTFD